MTTTTTTEYYALQIDAHVRFVQDWDSDLIQQWKNANNESKFAMQKALSNFTHDY